jgi:PAS domain S-box-containing protein
MAGDYETAMDAASKAQGLLWTSTSFFEEADYHFYGALTRTAYCDSVPAGERQQYLDAVAGHHKQLQVWAENCPENFENRAALVEAEIARIEGREFEAMRLYEQAIRSARDNGFVHNEAIAYECASAFYRARGFDQTADLYLRNARYCYLRWGADGKVRQLDELYPQLREEMRAPGPMGTIATPVEHLDLATVIKVSQSVSGEIVLEKLIHALMRTAIEQAGAERGLLILLRPGAQIIAAEAATGGAAAKVQLRNVPVTAASLPESVFNYVVHTGASVILDDASAQPEFATDPYIRQQRARSILCLPLTNQAKLIGALYLENNLTTRAFTPSRIAVLKLIASQAAISLENTRLYRDLEEREAKIRRLVDANIIGIFLWELEGRILEANDAFLRIVGYDRDDLVSGRLRWTDLTPPEWLERDTLQVAEMKRTGSLQPFEKEYFRKDGRRVPVLIGVASFDEASSQGAAFVLDLTERKRAEQERERLRQLEADLAQINRVSTMGELAASIAHEVNQPLSGIVSNASASLRFLAGDAPNLEEVRAAVSDIVRDGKRAGEIIGRVRALTRRSVGPREKLDLNETIQEVLALVADEAKRKKVIVRTQFADDLSHVAGDRVQLQQVVLNLVMNAIEAMGNMRGRERELVITTRNKDADDVQATVDDSGIGLDPNKIDKIFDSFYTTKPGGMGMGLSISRSILQAHGGQLWVEGKECPGTRFHFTIPKYQEEGAHAGAARA